MGIGIMGVIAVQIIWMNNAFKIKNELFSRSVNEALNSSINKFEFRENMVFAKQMMNLSRNDAKTDLKQGNTPKTHSIPKTKFDSITRSNRTPPPIAELNIDSLISHEFPASIIIQSPGFSARIDNSQPFEDKQFEELQKRMLKMRRQIQESFRQQSIIAENEMKRFESDPHANPFEANKNLSRELENSFSADPFSWEEDLPRLPQKMPKHATSKYQRKKDKKQGLAQINKFRLKENEIQTQTDRMFMELQNMKVGRNVNPQEIKKIVRRELQNRDVQLNFEFAIADAGKIRYISNAIDKNIILNSPFSVQLFPHDIIPKSTRLLIFFPNQKNYILKSLNWLLIVSTIFSLLIFVTFFFSIYFILKQKKISEMKADFLNNMTHEFKTPIATIGVAADSLLNQKVINNPEKISYFTNMIRKENHRMNDHVEKILTIARLERKNLELHLQETDIHELIKKVVTRFELHIKSREGKITTQLMASNPIVTTDSVHFASMLGNLIDNANKYSPEAPEIVISTQDANLGVIISVEDKGIGMSSSVQQKIFGKFYRESSGNVHNVKGFGLGLSYVKAIVDANHGRIDVSSELGQGSRFDVFIPYIVTNKSTINE